MGIRYGCGILDIADTNNNETGQGVKRYTTLMVLVKWIFNIPVNIGFIHAIKSLQIYNAYMNIRSLPSFGLSVIYK